MITTKEGISQQIMEEALQCHTTTCLEMPGPMRNIPKKL